MGSVQCRMIACEGLCGWAASFNSQLQLQNLEPETTLMSCQYGEECQGLTYVTCNVHM